MHHHPVALRIIGFLSSLLLTLAAYLIIVDPDAFGLKIPAAGAWILAFACVQFFVQSTCFIHLWNEKGPPWNLGIFISTLSILLIIIIGSLWIMNHLYCNMMPGQ